MRRQCVLNDGEAAPVTEPVIRLITGPDGWYQERVRAGKKGLNWVIALTLAAEWTAKAWRENGRPPFKLEPSDLVDAYAESIKKHRGEENVKNYQDMQRSVRTALNEAITKQTQRKGTREYAQERGEGYYPRLCMEGAPSGGRHLQNEYFFVACRVDAKEGGAQTLLNYISWHNHVYYAYLLGAVVTIALLGLLGVQIFQLSHTHQTEPIITVRSFQNRIYNEIAAQYYRELQATIEAVKEKSREIEKQIVELPGKREDQEVWQLMVRHATRTLNATNIVAPEEWPDEACKLQKKSEAEIRRVMILDKNDEAFNKKLRELASGQIEKCGIKAENMRYYYIQDLERKFASDLRVIGSWDFVIADDEVLLTTKYGERARFVRGGVVTTDREKVGTANKLFEMLFEDGGRH